jgi:hypothetical protein
MAGIPTYQHIVVVFEENHNYDEIAGNPQAPYINSLMASGANLTNFHAITHPSQPNYFALYAGSTFGTTDDNPHTEPDPTIYTVLKGAGLTFTGYVDQTRTAPISIMIPGLHSQKERRFKPTSPPAFPHYFLAAITQVFRLWPT